MGTPASLLDLIARGGPLQTGIEQKREQAMTVAALANAEQSKAAARESEVMALANEQKIRQQQEAMKDQAAIADAYRVTGGDPGKMKEFLLPRLSGQGIQGWEKHDLDLRKEAQKLKNDELVFEEKSNAKIAQLLMGISKAPDPVAAYASVFPQLPQGMPTPDKFTPEALPLILGGIGHYDAIVKDAKEQQAIKQAEAATKKSLSDTAREERAAFLSAIRPDMSQAEYNAVRETFKDVAKAFPAAPGAWVSAAVKEAIKPSDRAKVEQEQRVLAGMTPTGITAEQAARLAADEEQRKQQAQLAREGQAVTMRGQNMTDARSREMAEISRDKRPITEAESKTYGFYKRMDDAEKTLSALQEKMTTKDLAGQVYFKFAPNFMQSGDNQVYEQASRQFTEARLRRDSGAAIPSHEYESDKRMYFPQPGDGKEALERKKSAREVILKSMKNEAGRAIERFDGVVSGASSVPVNSKPLQDMTDAEIMERLK